MIVYASFLAEL